MNVLKNNHSGYCCGRFHVCNFDTYKMEDNLRSIKEELDRTNYDFEAMYEEAVPTYGDDPNMSGMCCEITLADYQINLEHKGKTFKTHLEDMGFKEVYKFLNPNSGNVVHVFLYSSNEVVA